MLEQLLAGVDSYSFQRDNGECFFSVLTGIKLGNFASHRRQRHLAKKILFGERWYLILKQFDLF